MIRGIVTCIAIMFACAVYADDGYFGAAEIDITPTTPIRLSGYAARTTESVGVQQRLYAKAAAFGSGAESALMIAVDCTGIPDNVADVVSASLSSNFGIARERIVISATHTHSGPSIDGYADNLFGGPLPAAQQQRIDEYTEMLTEKLETVGIQALTNRSPGHTLAFGTGEVDFGVNRRGGGGPVDQDLPVLRVTDALGTTKAIVTSYAAHAVTLNGSDNLVSGDWPGYAREAIENLYPEATALVMLGTAGDINPRDMGSTASARNHGNSIANEVQRLITNNLLVPVTGGIRAMQAELDLPFATERLPGDPSSARLAPTPASQAYGITSWTFGEDIAMVFLEGEVTVDYSQRLKSMYGDGRLWINAYTNDVQGYIPSERVLYEGGYEADDSGYYYGLPGRWAHGLEDQIVDEVVRQIDPFFNPQDRLTLQIERGTGQLRITNKWDQSINFDAYTIESGDGLLGGVWSSLASQGRVGWDEADNSSPQRLTEFNPIASLAVNPADELELGAVLVRPAPARFGEELPDPTLQFKYHVENQGNVDGRIEFIGEPAHYNNLVLTVDPETGEAAFQNESPFFDVAIDGYSIASNLGRLLTNDGQWNSLSDQNVGGWDEAQNSGAFRITEFNPRSELFLARDSPVYELGQVFDVNGIELSSGDLEFLFSIVGGEMLPGIVRIGDLPSDHPLGDYDRNGVVNTVDYTIWKATYGEVVVIGSGADGNRNGIVDAADYTIWRNNSQNGHGSGASNVPEPTRLSHALVLLAFIEIGCLKRLVARKVRT